MSYYVTFYSYKGGVGRTLTLVNVAVSLANLGHSVFIWELDLEAPGMLNLPFFHPLRSKAAGGTVDLLVDAGGRGAESGDDLAARLSRFVLEHPAFEPGRLRLLPAGAPDAQYSRLFTSIRWDRLFGEGITAGSELFEKLRQVVDSYNPAFVLIDSRTGVTDIGAICTVQLPDTVVLVYHLNHQSLAGTRDIYAALGDAKRLQEIRRRELNILRVACMVPAEWPELAARRRDAFEHAGPVLGAARRKQKATAEFNLAPHVEIPLNTSLLLEERIWTFDFPEAPLSQTYGKLAAKLMDAASDASARPPEAPAAGLLSREKDRVREGKSFEEKVGDILRLMGFDVELDVDIGGARADAVAHKREALQESWFVVECKAQQGPVHPDALEALRRALDVFRQQKPGAQGLCVSVGPPSDEQRAQAEATGIQFKTYDELLSDLVDLRPYLTALVQDVEGKDIERLYVEQDIWPEGSEARLPAAAYLKKWLADPDALHLTILGDYGTGKTWLSRKLACDFARRYRDAPANNRQPVRVDLRDAAKALSLENVLYDHFQRAGLDVVPKRILHLLAEGRLVLILDGFDEMATQSSWDTTLANFRELARAAQGKAKIILTCRTHYFKERAQVRELVEGRKPSPSSEGTELYKEVASRRGFNVAHLLEFDSEQVDGYINRACGSRAGEVRGVIERIPSLKDIAGRPVLLEMIVRSAPRLVESGGEINVARLYETYTEEWLRRQDWRLRLTREGRTTLVQELAVKLWETDGARIHYRELANVLAGLLKDRVTTDRELEMADYEVRTASFLTRDAEGHYGFSHRSFLEFFLAQRIARLLQEAAGDSTRITDALRLRLLSPQVIGFLRELVSADTLIPGLAGVLERPYARLASENCLLVLAPTDERSRQPKQFELEGADLAGLSLAGYRLPGANLSKARLAGANLSGAFLQSACLADADLTEARLENAICTGANCKRTNLGGAVLNQADLCGADFSDADLSFASLVGAQLDRATWEGATLDGTGFYGARVSEPFLNVAFYTRLPGKVHVEPGRLLAVPQTGPSGQVFSVAYSPDGKLVSAVCGGTIGVYDVVTGHCRRLFSGHLGRTWVAAWSPDGRQLASGGDDNTVRLRDVESGRLLRTLEGHGAPVTSVAWRGDGRQLASGSNDKTVRLWDAESGRLLRTLEGHGDWVTSVAWRGDGRQLASGGDDKTVRLWDADSGRLLRTLEGHGAPVTSVAWGGDGRQLASGGADQTVRLWDAESGRLLRALEGHGHWVTSVAWRGDGRQLASGGNDKTVRLWDADSGRLLRTLEGHGEWVTAVAWRGDGRQLASAGDDKTVRLWDVESWRLVRTLEGHGDWVTSVAWRGDGQQLASGGGDSTVRLWDAESGRLLRTLEGHGAPVTSVAWRGDGRQLASGGNDKTVRLWDVDSGRLLRTLEGHGGWVRSVAWRGDGRQLASGGEDKTVRLWDADGGLLRTLEGHAAGVASVAWRGDGRQLASGGDDQTVRLWDADSGRLLRTLEGHGAWVRSVAWGRDGTRLASGAADGSIRIWDTESGCCLVTLLHFAPSGWLALTEGNRFTGDDVGKRFLTFADGWALYPAAVFPELEDPAAVRRALVGD